jgi:hypothetical protein
MTFKKGEIVELVDDTGIDNQYTHRYPRLGEFCIVASDYTSATSRDTTVQVIPLCGHAVPQAWYGYRFKSTGRFIED